MKVAGGEAVALGLCYTNETVRAQFGPLDLELIELGRDVWGNFFPQRVPKLENLEIVNIYYRTAEIGRQVLRPISTWNSDMASQVGRLSVLTDERLGARQFDYTRRIGELLRDRRLSDIGLGTGFYCAEAELLFCQDLQLGILEDRVPGLPPMVILTDVNGDPFAVQKRSGEKSTYVFRSGELPIMGGSQYLPEGAVVKLDNRSNDGGAIKMPHDQAAPSTGVIIGMGPQAGSVAFLRLSSECLPDGVRSLSQHDAIEWKPSLGGQLEDARKFGSQWVADRVQALMRASGSIMEFSAVYRAE